MRNPTYRRPARDAAQVIADIAFQADILALHASIAQAGTGQNVLEFAGTSEEVRKLAGTGSHAARTLPLADQEETV